jgi:predicted component of type VI protein secretion system
MDTHLVTHRIETGDARFDFERDTDRLQTPLQTPLQSWISLHLIESGQILPLADRTEFTLGRSAEGQPIVPDVDLTSYNAYANGVSRLHAAIKLVNNRIVVVDLGSSNGTYLNGVRLSPYIETPVSHGDLIYLGKLKIQVLID